MKTQCTVEGCNRSFVSRGYMRAHAEKPHVVCSCGWAGVAHATHAAYWKRVGSSSVHDRVDVRRP